MNAITYTTARENLARTIEKVVSDRDPVIITKKNDNTKRNPTSGLGKPEPLRHALNAYWSRRITDEHRMVYRYTEDSIMIAQHKYLY